MQERHIDRKRYFDEQAVITEKYLIPYLSDVISIDENSRILEIGCGEGGNLLPFVNMGCEVVGVDIGKKRIENAKLFFSDHKNVSRTRFICSDIYDCGDELGKFDLIFLRDVIEHIRNQEKFMAYVKRFLKEDAIIFFAFPPWMSPFGGHQQVCESKWMSNFIYAHLLPRFIYRGLLKMAKEPRERIKSLMEVRDTGISIERFRRIQRREKYIIVKHTYYLINPSYEIKFGYKPRKVVVPFRNIPWLRNFYTLAYYIALKPGKD